MKKKPVKKGGDVAPEQGKCPLNLDIYQEFGYFHTFTKKFNIFLFIETFNDPIS